MVGSELLESLLGLLFDGCAKATTNLARLALARLIQPVFSASPLIGWS